MLNKGLYLKSLGQINIHQRILKAYLFIEKIVKQQWPKRL